MICIYDGAAWIRVDNAAEVMTDLEERIAALEAKQEG